MKNALYVPGKADFKQPEHGKGKTSAKKNPGKVGFKQPQVAAGKNKSGMMNVKGKVGFDQKTAKNTATSSKKNPGKVGFAQPNPAKKSVSTGISAKAVKMPKMDKMKGDPKVTDKVKFKSMDEVVSYRKKKYGA